MYKIINLDKFVSIPTRDYPTRNRGNLITPFPGVSSIKFNHEHQFMSVRNYIPAHIKEMSPFRLFKTKFINYFKEQY